MGDNTPFPERLGCTCFKSDAVTRTSCKGSALGRPGPLDDVCKNGRGKSQETMPTKAVVRFSLSVGLEGKYIDTVTLYE